MNTAPSVLVLVHGGLGATMGGPEIRGWETAKALRSRFRVTAAVRGDHPGSLDGIRLVGSSRRTVLREALRHDAVVAPELPPYLLGALHGRRTVTVSDQFCPVEHEHATLGDSPDVARRVTLQKAMRSLQLRYADVIVSAGEAQLRRTERELAGLGRRRPPLHVSATFGLPEPPPAATRRPLRKRFPEIRPDDTVIVWWGSIWRWLDAGTALRAIARIRERRDDVKLVLSSASSPSPGRNRFSTADEARDLAGSLDLLGQSAFFLEDWVPYDERHEYLADADIGISLHLDTPEAAIAARARYLDYLWTGLPCVLGRGDEIAAAFADGGFAQLVAPGDVDGTATALLRWVDDPAALAAARGRGPALAERFRWPAQLDAVADAVAEALPRRRRAPARALAPAAAAARYYARRVHERALAALPRRAAAGR